MVDDDPKTRASVRRYLEHAGYAVVEAEDGRGALVRARETPPPDLVVLDRMLPHLDGLAVCRHIKNSDLLKRIKVILYSSRESIRGNEIACVFGLRMIRSPGLKRSTQNGLVPRMWALPVPVMGLSQRRPWKRTKSVSAVCRTAPWSIARAAICASLTRFPAVPRLTSKLRTCRM